MRFGVHLVAAGKMIEGEKIARVARTAEELGYDSLWVSDHIIFPTELRSPYPYSPDGKLPLDPTNPLLEPFTVLTYAAAVTKTIKLGTSVIIVPYRDPIVTAKIISSLDVLSNGRFIFGVGVGWLEEEFRVLRQNMRDRAAQTREALLAMKACWTQEDPEFHGKFFDFSGIKFAPKPKQTPHPPISVRRKLPARAETGSRARHRLARSMGDTGRSDGKSGDLAADCAPKPVRISPSFRCRSTSIIRCH